MSVILVPALELLNINKHFDANEALNGACLQVSAGSIHGIIGENGAGKSTLMQIAYGLTQPDSGQIIIDGAVSKIASPQAAIRLGIGMLHQKVSWLEQLSVLENIVLGDKIDNYFYQDNRPSEIKLQLLIREFGFSFALDSIIGDLTFSQRQQVDIIRALYRGVRVLILDEPMAILSPSESKHLFDLFILLKNQGVSVVIVSHKLIALHQICDVISVVSKGQVIKNIAPSQVSIKQLTKYMVGREVLLPHPNKLAVTKGQSKVLTIVDIVAKGINGINFSVYAGQIVALVGLPKAGQDIVLEVLAGMTRLSTGSFDFIGHKINAKRRYSIAKARRLEVSYVPDPMLESGLIHQMSMAESSILGYQNKQSSLFGGFNRHQMIDHCSELMAQWQIRPADPQMNSGYFSGGNQQKMVMAREISQQPKLLLLNQPTSGVDVAGVELIYQQLFALRERGCAIILVSNDLDEVITLADFVVVLHQGKIAKKIAQSQLSKQQLGLLMVKGFADD